MTRSISRQSDQPAAATGRSPYQSFKANLSDAVAGAKAGWQEGGVPTPPQPPTPPAPPAPPTLGGVDVTDDGTIVLNGADGQKITVAFDQGTLRVTQGTKAMTVPWNELVPARAVDITVALCSTLVVLVLGAPLLRFWLRKVERRQAQQQLDAAVAARLAQLEQHVDTVAVELERVSEGQRYFTRLLEAREGAATPSRPA